MQKYVLFLLIFILTLSGCSGNSEKDKQLSKEKQPDTAIKETSKETKKPKETFGEPQVIDYNLGAREIVQASGWKVPYTVKGTMGVPTGSGKRPIVILLHGNHPIKKYDTDRYDQGFTYLVKDLARQGYLAVSMDINAQYVWEHGEPIEHERLLSIFDTQFALLTKAIKGEDAGFKIPLQGRGDLQHISFIGHSRGAQGTHALANRLKEKGIGTDGLLMAAPMELFVMGSLPDVPLGILLPQYDGDVTGLLGHRIFDREALLPERKNPISVAYMYGANHNFFNSKMHEKDDGIGPSKINDNLQKRLTVEEQQTFLSRYAVDFLNAIYDPDAKKNFYAVKGSAETTGQMYGHPVMSSLYMPGTQYILHPIKEGKVPLEGKVTSSEGVEFKQVTESYIQKNDEAGPFLHPGDQEKMNLLSVRWTQRGGELTIEVPENLAPKNEGNFTVYMAADPSDKLNEPDTPPAFSIVLQDQNDRSAVYKMNADTPAVRLQPGKLIKDDYAAYWSTYTPLSTLRIPLDAFDREKKFGEIRRVTLKFDQTDSGALMIGNLGFTKE
ncbi:hypothetical protein [Paenibacillus gansuensis]|uniref:Alpha/beta hydrolase n=1 Tax=Paenibacillus gansuensis TaxID=306542 RepID=A0ABW5PAI5_9BACL